MDIIAGPRQVHGARTASEYRAIALAFGERMGFAGLRDQTVHPAAYVSHGRWVVDCTCGNGPSASREWGLAVCFECGRVWQPLFPSDAASIEDTLLTRHRMPTRNWRPGETIQTLRAENVLRGGR